ncbi:MULTISPECIES: NAD(P)H-dependent flavin oxidoreductase [unclassified Viridibacillus]|uniref:NAD(P)H-dependent flavin oxidoreductase n=1 Tax=unclassified Viridibacillus TaxID=2617942 RepID=UPI00096ED8BE|nr:nitronate monooxygenase [Viridibacillus sp. FSL H8-0123]OMC84136.1 2-nitropropane dioxygenase [Viridibacillus sp. FSL H8-0123]
MESLFVQNILGIDKPILQAPMAGVTTPEFVAASANAGILGSIGAGYLNAEATRNSIREVKTLTDKSFSVNLFVPEQVEATDEQIAQAYEALKPFQQELGLSEEKVVLSFSEFAEQVKVVVDEGVKICSFTFGIPDQETISYLHKHETYCIGTATTVEEAIAVEQAGLDAVVLQGGEAGGHRGTFLEPLTLIPTMELLKNTIGKIKIPIITAGGIMTKKHMLELLNEGAEAIQIGTALLATEESGAHPLHKEAILKSEKDKTALTTAFSGKAARGIVNDFMTYMANQPIAPYPVQNDLTKELRKVAGQEGKAEYLSMWAGENMYLAKPGKVADIVHHFISEDY